MLTKFSGEEVIEILEQRAEDHAYYAWKTGRGEFRQSFMNLVWLKTSWTQWFYSGYLEGALNINRINVMEDNNTAEFQCMKHHFCVLKEKLNA